MVDIRQRIMDKAREFAGTSNQPASASPKWLLVLFYVMHPFYLIYDKQCELRYDPLRDLYYVKGLKLSGAFLRMLANKYYVGEKFEIVSNSEGIVTVRKINE